MKDLLLVIDMQKAYAADGPWACRDTEGAAANIKKVIASGKADEVIFTRFDAPVSPVGCWADYNRINREINEDPVCGEIIDSLKADAAKYPMYSKSTYNSMLVPEVAEAALKADRVVLTGVVAECCVIATALALIDAGCKVIYLSDGCTGFDTGFEAAVTKIIGALDYVHTKVMTTGEYLSE